MSASKRFKSERYLPDPTSIVSTSNDLSKKLEEGLDKLRSINLLSATAIPLFDPVNQFGNEDNILLWLFAKYGVSNVLHVATALLNVPKEGVTASFTIDAVRRFVLTTSSTGINISTIDVQQIIHILENCPDLLCSLKSSCQANSRHPSFIILCPPTSTCYNCHDPLVKYHECDVRVYTANDLKCARKCTLRCIKCSLMYNYSMYGNKHKQGFRFYAEERSLVEVSDTLYFERDLLNFQCSLANHSWVSFQGFAESFNSAYKLEPPNDLSPSTVSDAFYWGELESELRTLNMLQYTFKQDSDRERCMKVIEERRRSQLYPHVVCTEECKKRGCNCLWVTDGIWKVAFPHCMFRIKNTVEIIPDIALPNVCTEIPKAGMAFCEEHCALLERQSPPIPVKLREFIAYCGEKRVSSSSIAGESSIEHEEKTIKDFFDKFSPMQLDSIPKGESAVESQGLAKLLSEYPALADSSTISQLVCRKDIGQRKKLRRWSRGHQFIVRAGGHIDTWQPLYMSESPSQVFLIIIRWLISHLESTKDPCNEMKNIVLAYDNVCNLCRMKVSQKPLPLPAPYDQCWLAITKIIDKFHHKNHVDPQCLVKYSPDSIKAANPHFNTEAGEQTFVWVARYKHILCSMNKIHHLFYLHRMVRRRNQYTEKCYKLGKKPILPQATV